MLSQNATVVIKRGGAPWTWHLAIETDPLSEMTPVFVSFIDALLSLATRKMIAQNVRD